MAGGGGRVWAAGHFLDNIIKACSKGISCIFNIYGLNVCSYNMYP